VWPLGRRREGNLVKLMNERRINEKNGVGKNKGKRNERKMNLNLILILDLGRRRRDKSHCISTEH